MTTQATSKPLTGVVKALGEEPLFESGALVRIATRSPIGHYRVPIYVRGKRGVILHVIDRPLINNEEEGFGRNAGQKGHYYRIAFKLSELWPEYSGNPSDDLRIEVYETWLERT
jgi:nitrile hydratase